MSDCPAFNNNPNEKTIRMAIPEILIFFIFFVIIGVPLSNFTYKIKLKDLSRTTWPAFVLPCNLPAAL